MRSAIYEGRVRHRRFTPIAHRFEYRLFMMYLDLSELEEVSAMSRLCSMHHPAIARFRRKDYPGDPTTALDQHIRDRITQERGHPPEGPICLLTQLRYFGYCFNPVSFYYCFDESGTALDCVVAEVTNTPWKERHPYWLCHTAESTKNTSRIYRFEKKMHVSPFMDMEQTYRCALSVPGNHLAIQLENWKADTCLFDATLTMHRHDMTPQEIRRILLRYPLMTYKVTAAIYWQALKLWWKKAPSYPHPGTSML